MKNLAKSWSDLCGTLSLRDAGPLGAELLARWSEPHRAYHTTAHLAQVLDALDGADPRLALAAWFHDAIYDPKRSDNEALSAALAEEQLRAAGLPDDDRAFVADAILATAGHRSARPEFAPLLEADLAILAAAPAAYEAYRAGIRAEYAHVADPAFRAGRLAFVRAMLARGGLAPAALSNLERERERLEGGAKCD